MTGMERPEETVDWSEVEVSKLIDERDSARALAVRLEQELARAEERLSRSFRWFVFSDGLPGRWFVTLRTVVVDAPLPAVWREFTSRKKALRWARKHSGEAL